MQADFIAHLKWRSGRSTSAYESSRKKDSVCRQPNGTIGSQVWNKTTRSVPKNQSGFVCPLHVIVRVPERQFPPARRRRHEERCYFVSGRQSQRRGPYP